MIKIIRLHYMSILKIAGDFYIFNRRDETENCRDAANFMQGKDINDYLIIKNGQEVDIRGCFDVDEIENKLKNFKNF